MIDISKVRKWNVRFNCYPEIESLPFPDIIVEEQEDSVVVPAEVAVIADEIEKSLFLLRGEGDAGDAVVDNHRGQFKGKRILENQIVVHRHLESRTQYAANRMD